MSKTVLVVVAHSDDETISMAGTIQRHASLGDNVIAISMTDGVSSRDSIDGATSIANRKTAAFSASQILGFTWVESLNFQDNALDRYPLLDIVKAIERVKILYEPSLVYTHSLADLNIDHRVVTNAVLTAFRPQPFENCTELRLFETSSATDYGNNAITGSFEPNLFVDIADFWKSKEAALEAYGTELRPYPHSRSIDAIKNLGKLRGNQVGVELAEAFQVIRKIVK
jgi:LmbE family N-acetylglucosaminyl deacetylase